MSEGPAILCRYEGEGEFKAVNPVWGRRADRGLVVGEQYYITAQQQRSDATHRHYFACVRDAWENLPDELAKRFKTDEHLRKYALIKTGFYLSEQMVCPSERVAHKVAAFMRPMNEYGIISVDGKVITRFEAKSQSYKTMNKAEFAASKQAVLDYLSELIGAERQQLEAASAA